jgi:hypothetical protein
MSILEFWYNMKSTIYLKLLSIIFFSVNSTIISISISQVFNITKLTQKIVIIINVMATNIKDMI